MSEFYTGLQADAADTIAEFGTTGTLTRKTTSVPDATKPHVVEPVEAEHDIVLVAGQFELRDIDGTVILSGDRRLYVAAEGLSVVPEPGDEIAYNSETLTVVNASPINPAGTALLFDVQVRA